MYDANSAMNGIVSLCFLVLVCWIVGKVLSFPGRIIRAKEEQVKALKRLADAAEKK